MPSMHFHQWNRRELVALLGGAATSSFTSALTARAQLVPIAPSEAGFAGDLEARLDKAVADKRVWNLHGIVVVRDERLVLERYFEGEDNARGQVARDGRVHARDAA